MKTSKDPRAPLLELRYSLTRLTTSFTLAEHGLIEAGDSSCVVHACKKWYMLHWALHLSSPYADAYRYFVDAVRDANESQLIPTLSVDFLSDAEDVTFSSIRRQQVSRKKYLTTMTKACIAISQS